MAKSVAYCKRLRYIYELSLEREVEEDGEREARETSVGTRQWSRHTYACINRDRSGDDDGRRQRLKCEININPSSSAI